MELRIAIHSPVYKTDTFISVSMDMAHTLTHKQLISYSVSLQKIAIVSCNTSFRSQSRLIKFVSSNLFTFRHKTSSCSMRQPCPPSSIFLLDQHTPTHQHTHTPSQNHVLPPLGDNTHLKGLGSPADHIMSRMNPLVSCVAPLSGSF